MNCWEAYMQVFHQHKILIKEQQVKDINPLCELAYTFRDLLRIPLFSLTLHSAPYTYYQG